MRWCCNCFCSSAAFSPRHWRWNGWENLTSRTSIYHSYNWLKQVILTPLFSGNIMHNKPQHRHIQMWSLKLDHAWAFWKWNKQLHISGCVWERWSCHSFGHEWEWMATKDHGFRSHVIGQKNHWNIYHKHRALATITSHISCQSGNCHIRNVTNCMPTFSLLLLVQLLK